MIRRLCWWQRLEPRTRRNAVRTGARAPVRDPLWMLARQWQVGEFNGEDAASPVAIDVDVALAPQPDWSRLASSGAVGDAASMQLALTAEPRRLSLAARIRLGRAFFDLLSSEPALASGLSAIKAEVLAAAPLNGTPSTSLERLGMGRVPDPETVAMSSAATVASWTSADPALEPVLVGRVAVFRSWLVDVFGAPSASTAPAGWETEALCHRAEGLARLSVGAQELEAKLAVEPNADGSTDWYSVEAGTSASVASAGSSVVTRRVLPSRFRVPGGPTRRWWEYERSGGSFADVSPDRNELAMMLLLDFVHLHGADWFSVPLTLPTGAAVSLQGVRVRTAFDDVLAPPPPSLDANRAPPWQMFSLSGAGITHPVLLFGGSPSEQDGPTLEEVRFLRDEQANLAWAVEETVQDASGRGVPGREFHVSGRSPRPSPREDVKTQQERKHPSYRVMELPPMHWWPLRPVGYQAASGATGRWQLGGMPGGPVEPLGVLVAEIDADELAVHAVPRGGVEVRRAWRRSRDRRGQIRVWVGRSRHLGAPRTASPLRWDSLSE